MKKKIVIIGAGRVGTALGYLLYQAGFPVVAVGSRSARSLERAGKYLPRAYFSSNLPEVARKGEIVLLSVKDEAIPPVARKIASKGGFKKGQIVFHLSGALSTEVLKSAKEKGAIVASLHPIQTLASVDLAIANLPGSIFGFSGEEKAKGEASKIVKALKGKMFTVSDELKPAYHAAACVGSNYLVALVFVALELYQLSGLTEKQSREALIPLLEGTVKNLKKTSPVEALTGPIARGDLKTVKSHLKTLKKIFPEILPFYCENGKITAQIALRKGLEEKTYQELISLLEKYL